jgi:hypothetical protein
VCECGHISVYELCVCFFVCMRVCIGVMYYYFPVMGRVCVWVVGKIKKIKKK